MTTHTTTNANPAESLAGQAAIVTGGAGSLGSHIAHELLARGADVLLVDRDATLLATTQALLEARFPGRVASQAADVSQTDDTRAYIAEALNRWGRLDMLVCNAGIAGIIAPLAEYPEDVFDAVMAVNVRGGFLACRHGLGAMADGGRIVLVSSIMGVTADPGVCAYATSKHALAGLGKVAAKEGAPRGIRVNVVAPGPIDNTFQADIEADLGQALGRDATRMLNDAIPLGRHANPREVAAMVTFLLSDSGSFCTGGIYMVDGGMHI